MANEWVVSQGAQQGIAAQLDFYELLSCHAQNILGQAVGRPMP